MFHTLIANLTTKENFYNLFLPDYLKAGSPNLFLPDYFKAGSPNLR